MITKLTDEQINELVAQLAPKMADYLMRTPTVYGDQARLKIGEGVKVVNTFFNLNSGTVTIGDYTFFGNNVSVLTGSHDIKLHSPARRAFPKKGYDVVIGRGVWIASHAIVIGPCIIGDNSVVGAGSLVLPGDYPADSLIVGVPAKVKRKIEFKD